MAELLVLEPERPGEGLESMLEEMLERVRAGEVSSIAIAYVQRDGRAGRMWSEAPSLAALLGSIQRLAHRIQVEWDEQDDAAQG
jgi:hypothetical protein